MPSSRKRKQTKRTLKTKRYQENCRKRILQQRYEQIRNMRDSLRAEMNKEKVISAMEEIHGEE